MRASRARCRDGEDRQGLARRDLDGRAERKLRERIVERPPVPVADRERAAQREPPRDAVLRRRLVAPRAVESVEAVEELEVADERLMAEVGDRERRHAARVARGGVFRVPPVDREAAGGDLDRRDIHAVRAERLQSAVGVASHHKRRAVGEEVRTRRAGISRTRAPRGQAHPDSVFQGDAAGEFHGNPVFRRRMGLIDETRDVCNVRKRIPPCRAANHESAVTVQRETTAAARQVEDGVRVGIALDDDVVLVRPRQVPLRTGNLVFIPIDARKQRRRTRVVPVLLTQKTSTSIP